MNATTFLFSWLPPVVWCGLIFYMSSIPGLNSGLGVWDLILRKCAHMFEFGVLALLFARAFRRTWIALAPAGIVLLSFVLTLLYAISDEVHQSFVPNRGPSAMDVLVDTAGIVAAFVFVFFLNRRRRDKVVAAAKTFALLVLVIPLVGCGADAQFKRAKGAETAGRPYEAWQKYQEFAARNPDDARTAEALFRAGWLAESVLGDCTAAKSFYARVEKEYMASQPWSAQASFQSANCPDFFPLVPGSAWVEGDSESGGKNARIESICEASSGTAAIPMSAGIIVRSYYGGNSKFKTSRTLYRKEGATVWEFEADSAVGRGVLRGPLDVGTTWEGELAGRTFRYEVVSDSATVTVRGGTFPGCLLVRARADGVPGATNEYYAPFVGRVLTSFSGEGGERRNTELLSYKPGARDKVFE